MLRLVSVLINNTSARVSVLQSYRSIAPEKGVTQCSRGGWTVEGPLAESPAEESGILPGHRLVEIDGYPADLLTPLEIAALMRGPAGSSVMLTMAENVPHSKTWSLDLERRPLPQPPMKSVPSPFTYALSLQPNLLTNGQLWDSFSIQASLGLTQLSKKSMRDSFLSILCSSYAQQWSSHNLTLRETHCRTCYLALKVQCNTSACITSPEKQAALSRKP